jgi:hypothetical protein
MLVGAALAGALVAGCSGGDDRSVGIGQVDDSTTTTTTATVVTTTTPAPAPLTPAPPCTPDALRAGYDQTYGANPAGSVAPQGCTSDWALATYSDGVEAPTFVLFHAENGAWVAKSRGVANVCEGQGVPPRTAAYIGCDT